MPDLVESMFYVGETPWHGKGVPLTESPTIEDALILAGMDWQVQKIPTTFQLYDGDSLDGNYINKETGHFVNVRMDTMEVVGNVGAKYEVLQNEDAFKPFSVLVDYGYKFETAGVIDNGKKVWILAKTPNTYLVGDDKILDYVMLYTSHDGSSGSCFRDVAIRVVCQNTLDSALSSRSTSEYKLKHTASIKSRVDELTKNLDKREGNVNQAIGWMNRFHETPLNDAEFTFYVEAVMPWLKTRHKVSNKELGILVRNRALPVYNTIDDLFRNGKGNKGETLWDAYNAITEYHDHHKKHKDWVKGTQFGQSRIDKRNAFYYATKVAQTKQNDTIITYN